MYCCGTKTINAFVLFLRMLGSSMGSGFLYDEDGYFEFVDRVHASYEHPANKQRLGQLFFNKLHDERPAIAERIRGTMFDPFAYDFIHVKIGEVVREMWYEENNKD